MGSLDRYSNINEIRTTPGLSRGMEWSTKDIPELLLTELAIRPDETPVVEMHIYTPATEVYLGGGPITAFVVKDGKLYIDYVEAFTDFNIKRGYFKVNINVYYDIVGTYEYPLLKVTDIAPNNSEMLLTQFASRYIEDDQETIVKQFLDRYLSAYDNDFALNLGNNEFAKIVGLKEYQNEDTLALKLYKPFQANDIELLQRVHLVEVIADSYIDNVSLDQLAPTNVPNSIKPPNFEIDTGYTTITETDFKSWNQLLGSNATTSQKIIESMFSGSLSGVDLGIDYSGFDKFVYYGSAYDRVYNFKQKLEQVEYYDQRLGTLNNTSGSISGSLSVNINSTLKRKDALIGTFDKFETWLYNEPTASIFTHGLSGSIIAGVDTYAITPWPKYLTSTGYKLYHTTASISENWYASSAANGVSYDTENPHQLAKTIPQYIREDVNNSEYDKFVNMIAQHFDILYTYANALTQVHVKEEHPKRGIDKDILPAIAKSQGWQLVNGNQASQLSQYKLGTDESGSYAQTGSIFSISDEQITGEVWRRIVNNLPYILKTRGTVQSIDALLNIYGVPKSLLSIREYGGPKVSATDWPVLTEDRYSYAIDFNTGSFISYSALHVSASINYWGRGVTTPNVIPAQTREFRFKPYTSSSMLLYSQVNNSGDPLIQLAVEHTGSYSGSSEFGRLNVSFGSGSGVSPITASSNWIPVFNGSFWNVAFSYITTGTDNTFNTGSNADTIYRFRIQEASDFIKGKISHTSSFDITPTNTDHYLMWSEPSVIDKNVVYIGGNTGSGDLLNVNSYLSNLMDGMPGTYSGSMQEFREYLEDISQIAFDDHTLNPSSYVSGLSPSSSYDTLVRQYTLGSETIGIDLSTDGTIISSSHPNQKIKDFTTANAFSTNATAIGFEVAEDLERGNFLPVEETYYIRGASVGANNPRSEKIRLESNYLTKRLSPINSSEVSSFDNAPLDSHKLGLFYSFADQVNKDIFNHTGRVELDDFIGDPDDEYTVAYEDLKRFSGQYWKKFTNASDVNSYNRIFSQFDFTLFNQIKQTLPERIDEATGLLIEPNILERSKVQITKQPRVNTPTYDASIADFETTWSADITDYEGVIGGDESATVVPSAIDIVQYTGFVGTPTITGSMNYCTIAIPPVDELVEFTASIIDSNYEYASVLERIVTDYNNQSVLFKPEITASNDNWRNVSATNNSADWWNENISNQDSNINGRKIQSTISANDYTKQIRLQLDTVSQYDTKISIDLKITSLMKFGTMPLSGSYVATLATTSELNGVVDVNHRYDNVLASTEGALTVNSTTLSDTISFEKILVPANTLITCIIQFKNISLVTDSFFVYKLVPIITIHEVCHSFKQLYVDEYRKSGIYSETIYHYSGSSTFENKRERINNGLLSQSLGMYYSSSIQTAPYHDDFFEKTERLYFNGTQLTAPGINMPSADAALDGKPIVQIYEVNANQIFYNTTPQQAGLGNTLDPGNLTVR
jgi:hypothetical protein